MDYALHVRLSYYWYQREARNYGQFSMSSENNRKTLIFDGHNDVLSKLRDSGGVSECEAFLGDTEFHIDLVKAAEGGFGGGFFAMWVASPDNGVDYQSIMMQERYNVPLPEPVARSEALDVVLEQAAILLRLESLGAVKICTTTTALRSCLGSGKLAAILHLEGCEAIDEDFHALDVLYAAGLRSLGPVWSRSTVFGDGVPFRYPSLPDIGTGLTELGEELVRRCNRMGVMLDLSHLNLAGFHDVARLSTAPLVATHSNAHALCAHARNLTDEQLEIIRASGGMVGLNFASAFLRQDGRMLTNVPVEQLLRHIDYLMESLGEDGVGLGSDFDGAKVPDAINNCAGLPVLVNAMRHHGYGEILINKLSHDNWLNVLERTWN